MPPRLDDDLHQALRAARSALICSYVLHASWFFTMGAFVGWDWSERGLRASALLTLVTVPPVLYYIVRVHKLCRAIDPRSRTVGWGTVLITTLLLSPFESGLVLPVNNLVACNRILRGHLANPGQKRIRGNRLRDRPRLRGGCRTGACRYLELKPWRPAGILPP